MRVLMNMSGTGRMSVQSSRAHTTVFGKISTSRNIGLLLISVRTEDTRLINRALTLALSC
jgi:hypothetical protein